MYINVLLNKTHHPVNKKKIINQYWLKARNIRDAHE